MFEPKHLCWAAKPGSKFVNPGRFRASHQSLRLWKASGKEQDGYSFLSRPASKTDSASLTRTPRRSIVAKSIFKNFEPRALTPIRLTNGITRKSSSEKHQRDRGSAWAGGLASSALLGMTDEQTFAVGLMFFDAVLKPICTIGLGMLSFDRRRHTLMLLKRSIPRGCCIREILQSLCKQKGAQSA